MTLFFTRIPYAVTQPNGKWVDEHDTGHEPLICEYCGVRMESVIEPEPDKIALIMYVLACRVNAEEISPHFGYVYCFHCHSRCDTSRSEDRITNTFSNDLTALTEHAADICPFLMSS